MTFVRAIPSSIRQFPFEPAQTPFETYRYLNDELHVVTEVFRAENRCLLPPQDISGSVCSRTSTPRCGRFTRGAFDAGH